MAVSVLFAGPYFGEFGHEVLGVGLLRAKAQNYDRIIVCSRRARKALYDGLATEFRTHDIQCTGMCERATHKTMPSKQKIASHVVACDDRFFPVDCGRPKIEAEILGRGIYYRFGRARDEWRGVAAFHARSRSHDQGRNWSQRSWHKLARWIFREGLAERIVCVGTKKDALMAEGCCDMRGSDLKTQMDIGASAAFVIGPSSGWMHLASLCGCPHLTWVGGKEHVYVNRRYLRRWNPLNTPVQVMDGWQPSLNSVRNALKGFLASHNGRRGDESYGRSRDKKRDVRDARGRA